MEHIVNILVFNYLENSFNTPFLSNFHRTEFYQFVKLHEHSSLIIISMFYNDWMRLNSSKVRWLNSSYDHKGCCFLPSSSYLSFLSSFIQLSNMEKWKSLPYSYKTHSNRTSDCLIYHLCLKRCDLYISTIC